jgi:hypothetical protein
MGAMQHWRLDTESESEHQIQRNKKSALQAVRIDREKPESVLAKIYSPWTEKKLKTCIFEDQQHGVANYRMQPTTDWKTEIDGRMLHKSNGLIRFCGKCPQGRTRSKPVDIIQASFEGDLWRLAEIYVGELDK